MEHSASFFFFSSPHVAENHGLKRGASLAMLFKLPPFLAWKKERSRKGLTGDNILSPFLTPS